MGFEGTSGGCQPQHPLQLNSRVLHEGRDPSGAPPWGDFGSGTDWGVQATKTLAHWH